MSAALPFIVYLHGFNSSPQSHKAQLLREVLQQRGLSGVCTCPALPTRGREAMAMVEAELEQRSGHAPVFVGSSLGGFYATWLAEKHDGKSVLINPAISPHTGLRDYLGPQQNLYSGESYELTEDHLRDWERLYVPVLTPSRYLLLVETGDEVLDYREAVKRYHGARQLVVQGGDHSLQSFSRHIPLILQFAGLP